MVKTTLCCSDCGSERILVKEYLDEQPKKKPDPLEKWCLDCRHQWRHHEGRECYYKQNGKLVCECADGTPGNLSSLGGREKSRKQK